MDKWQASAAAGFSKRAARRQPPLTTRDASDAAAFRDREMFRQSKVWQPGPPAERPQCLHRPCLPPLSSRPNTASLALETLPTDRRTRRAHLRSAAEVTRRNWTRGRCGRECCQEAQPRTNLAESRASLAARPLHRDQTAVFSRFWWHHRNPERNHRPQPGPITLTRPSPSPGEPVLSGGHLRWSGRVVRRGSGR
jgi:hypothetical protein